MARVVPGPWDSPTPREEQHERRHADTLDFIIAKIEADPDATRALKDVAWFACRSPFKAVRKKALEALRVAGDRLEQQ